MTDELEFDPLAPITFEPNENEGYYVEYIPAIEEPAPAEPVAVEKPVEPVSVRFEKTVKGLPGLKKLLYHTVDWCREEREDRAIIDEIARFQGKAVSIYQPDTLLALLEECGALVRTNPPVLEGVDVEGVEGAETVAANGQAPREAEVANEQVSAVEAPAAEEPAEAVESAVDPAAETDAVDEDAVVSIELEGAYLEAEEPEAARYQAHEEALAIVDADDPLLAFAQLVDTKPQYVPLFERVLVACAEEAGATKKVIDALIDKDPVCKSPRVFSGYFVDKLEAAGAIEFSDAWHITPVGEGLLAEGGLLNRA